MLFLLMQKLWPFSSEDVTRIAIHTYERDEMAPTFEPPAKMVQAIFVLK